MNVYTQHDQIPTLLIQMITASSQSKTKKMFYLVPSAGISAGGACVDHRDDVSGISDGTCMYDGAYAVEEG